VNKQLLLGNGAVTMADQIDEHVKGLGLQRNRLSRTAEFIALWVQFIVAKDVEPSSLPRS
jgi:hypothetical protein